ncbi:TadE/TadG family type IV pilus assembly protein [Rhizobium sp. PAMB 3174]
MTTAAAIREGAFKRLGRVVQRLRADRRGVSAIEFALIMPILVILLAGTVDLGQALIVNRKVNQISSTVADMISRSSSWKTADVDVILAGSATILQPFSTNGLTIQLAVIDVATDLSTTVNWSVGYQVTALTKGAASPLDIPNDVKTSGVQMIVVETKYSLVTPFTSLLSAATGVTSYNYDKFHFTRPRIGDTLTLN